MKLGRVAIAFAAAVAIAGGASSTALAVPATETIYLDSHEAPSVGFAGPVSSTQTLSGGTYYVATVSGTYSLWKSTQWSSTCRGTSLSSPTFSTSGVTNGRVGVDAESLFAAPKGAGGCTASLPKHFDVFQVLQVGTWSHVEPTRGQFNTPTSDHTYKYVLKTGTTAVPFQFRIRDYHTADNYGRLQILLRKAWDGDCSNGGWADFNGSFHNQNQCTAALPNS
jgi:hypothetical protein